MQPESILQDVIATTPLEWLSQIEDAYVIGVEDAFIALCRANLIKPSHMRHANEIMQICVGQAKNQVQYSQQHRVPREGLDL